MYDCAYNGLVTLFCACALGRSGSHAILYSGELDQPPGIEEPVASHVLSKQILRECNCAAKYPPSLPTALQVREGKSGTLHAFVIPNISPKTCVSVSHKIRPLCLHMRLPGVEDVLASKPTNELLITGGCNLLCLLHGYPGRTMCWPARSPTSRSLHVV